MCAFPSGLDWLFKCILLVNTFFSCIFSSLFTFTIHNYNKSFKFASSENNTYIKNTMVYEDLLYLNYTWSQCAHGSGRCIVHSNDHYIGLCEVNSHWRIFIYKMSELKCSVKSKPKLTIPCGLPTVIIITAVLVIKSFTSVQWPLKEGSSAKTFQRQSGWFYSYLAPGLWHYYPQLLPVWL